MPEQVILQVLMNGFSNHLLLGFNISPIEYPLRYDFHY